MKYNDISIKKWNEKQLEKSRGESISQNRSSRAWRRERERELVSFGFKVKSYIESTWWDSFNTEERVGINMRWTNFINKDRYYSKQLAPNMVTIDTQIKFKAWIEAEYIKVKPNKTRYRDNKLTKILNNN